MLLSLWDGDSAYSVAKGFFVCIVDAPERGFIEDFGPARRWFELEVNFLDVATVF